MNKPTNDQIAVSWNGVVRLEADAGNDVFEIRAPLYGNDLIFLGTSERDAFRLSPQEGRSHAVFEVRGFESGRDALDLRAFAGLSFGDVVQTLENGRLTLRFESGGTVYEAVIAGRDTLLETSEVLVSDGGVDVRGESPMGSMGSPQLSSPSGAQGATPTPLTSLAASDGDELFRYDGTSLKLRIDISGSGTGFELYESVSGSVTLTDFSDWSGGSSPRGSTVVRKVSGSLNDTATIGDDGADVILTTGAGVDASSSTEDRLIVLDSSFGGSILGGSGRDLIYSRSNSVIEGGAGDDTIIHNLSFGNQGAYGGAGDDVIYLLGAMGRAFGGEGDDVIRDASGAGGHRLSGGSGRDTFEFVAPSSDQTDSIVDYDGDVVRLIGGTYSQSVSSGTLTITHASPDGQYEREIVVFSSEGDGVSSALPSSLITGSALASGDVPATATARDDPAPIPKELPPYVFSYEGTDFTLQISTSGARPLSLTESIAAGGTATLSDFTDWTDSSATKSVTVFEGASVAAGRGRSEDVLILTATSSGNDAASDLDRSADTEGRMIVVRSASNFSIGIDATLGSGHDFIYSEGNDTIRGGGGNDTIIHGDANTGSTNEGYSKIYGGAGDDVIHVRGKVYRSEINNAFIRGGDDDDTFYLDVTSGGDRVYGDGGDDVFFIGLGGDDPIWGGAGADTYVFTAANGNGTASLHDFDASQGDRLVFQGDAPTQSGTSGTFSFEDGGGFVISNFSRSLTMNDTLPASAVAVVEASAPTAVSESLTASDGTEVFRYDGSLLKLAIDDDGSSRLEVFETIDDGTGFAASDFTDWTGSGTRSVDVAKFVSASAASGSDADVLLLTLHSPRGSLSGGATLDLSATETDRFVLSRRVDGSDSSAGVRLLLGEGSDFVYSEGDDVILSGGGDDTVVHGDPDSSSDDEGSILIRTGSGDDVVYLVGSANRLVEGGSGSDSLIGDTGVDSLSGGDDDDVLTGGLGDDVFVFRAGEIGTDTITDFVSGDKLRLIGGWATQRVSGGTLTIEHTDGGSTATIVVDGVSATLGSSAFTTETGDVSPRALSVSGAAVEASLPLSDGTELFRFDGTHLKLAVDLDGSVGWDSRTPAVVIYEDIAFGGTLSVTSFPSWTLSGRVGGETSDVLIFKGSGLSSGSGRSEGVLLLSVVDGFSGSLDLSSGDMSRFVSVFGSGSVTLRMDDDDDVVYSEGSDTIYGSGGHDVLIHGGLLSGRLVGGSGNDTLVGGMGDDRLEAGSGDDLLLGGAGSDTFVFGSPTGSSSSTSTIRDFDGSSDKLLFVGGSVSLTDAATLVHTVGDGTQTVILEGVTETVSSDVFVVSRSSGGVAPLLPLTGSLSVSDGDELFRYDGTYLKLRVDVTGTGFGVEFLESVVGSLTLSSFTDWENGGTRSALVVDSGSDGYSGGNSDADVIIATGGRIDVSPSTESRLIYYGGDSLSSGTSVLGGGGDDLIYARTGGTVLGDAGSDTILFASATSDAAALGGAGDDTIYAFGTTGGTLIGGLGDDSLIGGSGDDVLIGGSGDDVIEGGAGDDRIESGVGDDSLSGGLGGDTFVFESPSSSSSGDANTITDFDSSSDKLLLKGGSVSLSADGATLTHSSGSFSQTIILDGFTGTLTSGNFISSEGGIVPLLRVRDTLSVSDGDELFRYDGTYLKIRIDVSGSGSGVEFYASLVGTLTLTDFTDWSGGSSPRSSTLVRWTGTADFDGGDSDADVILSSGGLVDVSSATESRFVYFDGDGIGSTVVEGGSGDDVIYSSSNGTVLGGGGDDVLVIEGSSSLAASLEGDGGGGDDRIYVLGDVRGVLRGGSGDDVLVGGGGDDNLHAGSGDDVLTGGSGGDTFIFESPTSSDTKTITDFDSGSDKILLKGGSAILLGDSLVHTVGGFSQTVVLEGFTGTLASDRFLTTDGGVVPVFPLTSTLSSSDGDEAFRYDGEHFKIAIDVDGSAGSSSEAFEGLVSYPDGSYGVSDYTGSSASALIYVGSGVSSGRGRSEDVLILTATSSLSDANSTLDISSSSSDRLVWVRSSSSSFGAWVETGGGDDVLIGGSGSDFLDGGSGDDTLLGGGGDDSLKGGSGDDTLVGGAGGDRLEAGSGDDVLRGGAGGATRLFSGLRRRRT